MCKTTNKYTIKQFREDYPNDDVCLDKLFKMRFGSMQCCPKCSIVDPIYVKVKSRMCYECSDCLHQIYPMAGTIFHRTRTPLTYWFYVMFLFTASKNGVSAYEVQRIIGVTYKTAWRMLKQIRVLMSTDQILPFEGVNEVDETFVGGKNKNRHRDKKVEHSQGRSFKDKTPVFGIYNRKTSGVRCFVVDDTQRKSIQPIICKYIPKGTVINTDEWSAYHGLEKDYDRRVVDHGKGNYANGEFTTNRIENFWTNFKRTINGSYFRVSKKYLQLYADETTFRFNHRNSNEPIFSCLVNLLSE